ncbi:MAG: (2Fe-2S) ferredoxin domain-containing protein, partial [Clostridia bacterium]|nr:(2Fe-2S) ferredoxin domain-containing protein [Clostridia bacterium]
MDIYRAHVLCCGGTGCTSSGSAQLIERFEQKIAENGLEKEVKVIRTGCFGLCEAGPVVIVYPEGTFYSRVKVEDVDEINKRALHHVTVSQTGCIGMCRLEPMVDVIEPGKAKVTYVHM